MKSILKIKSKRYVFSNPATTKKQIGNECTPPLTHPIEIHVKCGLQKAKFLAYKLPGWFGTAIFLKFRIFVIILVNKNIYGHPESFQKMASEVGQ